MHAVVLTGFGGPERLELRDDVPVPQPGPGEVLVRVGAAGVNNTDINTRTGWYSKAVRGGTEDGATSGWGAVVADDGGWAGGALEFPRIQGADAAGTIEAVGVGVDAGRIGERVLVRTMQAPFDPDDPAGCVTLGSEIDGAFAQWCAVRSSEAFAIESDLTDVELASFPCACSTAENLLHRAGVAEGDRVLVTGASGGVGSAAIQLARRRGAEVIGVAAAAKHAAMAPLGADRLVDRGADLLVELGRGSVDVVIDLVAGPTFPALLDVLVRAGRYATSGAIAGPIVDLDVRTLYLRDLTLLGATVQPRQVFEDLVGHIERGEVRPLVAATYPLARIAEAQERFVAKDVVGKLVLVPPPLD